MNIISQEAIMSFKDVLKKSVLQGFSSANLSTAAIVATLAFATLLGLYIYVIYRVTTKSGFYSRGFNKSLAVLPVITAGILLAMQGTLSSAWAWWALCPLSASATR